MLCGFAFSFAITPTDAQKESVSLHETNLSIPIDLDQKVRSNRPTQTESASISGDIYQHNDKEYTSNSNIEEKRSYYTSMWGKWSLNETDPSDFMTFTKRAESSTCEIWVADDLSFMSWDPRNEDPSKISITDVQVQLILSEWDQEIYPTMTDFIGPPMPRDGNHGTWADLGYPSFQTEVPERTMIMIFNIVDDSFWDYTLPYYGQGFFDYSYLEGYDRNVIHISSYDWANRLGPEKGIFSYQYEYILTHEYEHLLNQYFNLWQEMYLDEGCAEYSWLLMGHGVNYVQYEKISDFLATPDNSLTVWYDQWATMNLADYGAALLFVTYIADHFGLNVIHDLIDTKERGIRAVNSALHNNGYSDWDFNKVFKNWRIANLVHSDEVGDGWYNYQSIDLSSPSIGDLRIYQYSHKSMPWTDSAAEGFGNTISRSGLDTGVSILGPYGTDYIYVAGGTNKRFTSFDRRATSFEFDGEDIMQGWQRQPSPKMPSEWETKSLMEDSVPWHIEYKGAQYLEADVREHDFYAMAESNNTEGQPVDEILSMNNGIDTTGRTGIEVQFDVWYYSGYQDTPNEYPQSFSEILISTDGGGSFSSIGIIYDTYAEWYSSSINIDAFSGYSDVRLAFRYFDNSIAGNWGMLFIDNVKIIDGSGSPMYYQNFDNDILDTWWSDTGESIDYSLLGEADLSAVNSVRLTIETKWRMETPYDGGMVEVSTDRGVSWIALSNEYSASFSDPAILPELREKPVLNGAIIWSQSQDWVTMSYDLSQFAGQNILYRFRLITDDAWTDCGWFIKNIWINDEIVDPVTMTFTTHPRDDWMVTVYFPANDAPHRPNLPAKVVNLDPKDGIETAILRLSKYSQYPEMYIIISDTIGPNDYGFGIKKNPVR